jgi:beta-lactamase regulating signal transducer with metallopeptidase domain
MTGWIGENLLASGLLIALVLLVRMPVARLFGARAALALWLAPLVRLVIPPVRIDAPAPDIWIETTATAARSVAPAQHAFPLVTIMVCLWAAGVALFLLVQLVGYQRFVGRAVAMGRRLAATGTGDIPVIATPAVAGPVAAGLIDRRIFVPLDFTASFTPEEQALALRHELMHHRRRDLWAGAAALLVVALHWFNPLAHVAHRAFRRDLETACDADLLAATAPGERATYATAIVKCAAGPIPQPVCALTDTEELKGRLKMMSLKHGFAQRMLGSLLATAIAAGGLLLALPAVAQSPAGPDEPTVRTEVRKVVLQGPDGKVMHDKELSELPKCKGERFEASFDKAPAKDKVEKQRVVICAKDKGESKAEFADSLQKAIDRLQSQSDMSSEGKADIIAKLKARIAELRAGK